MHESQCTLKLRARSGVDNHGDARTKVGVDESGENRWACRLAMLGKCGPDGLLGQVGRAEHPGELAGELGTCIRLAGDDDEHDIALTSAPVPFTQQTCVPVEAPVIRGCCSCQQLLVELFITEGCDRLEGPETRTPGPLVAFTVAAHRGRTLRPQPEPVGGAEVNNRHRTGVT